MTNSERIKNMSDDELSVFLAICNEEYVADCVVDMLSNEKKKMR